MAGQLTIDTLKASSGVLATQNGMTGIAKAWVQFSYIGGTLTINNSFNVSSFTRNSTGNYTITFTTNMPNANYSVISSGSLSTGASWCWGTSFTNTSSPYYTAPTTSSCQVMYFSQGANALVDPAYGNYAVFGS